MYRIGESTISKITVFHLKLLGLWPPENSSLFYSVYSSLLYVIFSIIYVFCMLMNLLFIRDPKEIIHSLYMTLTCVALLFKTLNFLWYRRDMQNNLKTVYNFELENDAEVSIVSQRSQLYRNFLAIYYFMINGTCIAAFIDAIYRDPWQLPFRAWYPIDWRHDRQKYWIAYTYQSLGMVVQANLNISIEIFPGYLMYMTQTKIDILSMRLQRQGECKPTGYLVKLIKLHQNIVK